MKKFWVILLLLATTASHAENYLSLGVRGGVEIPSLKSAQLGPTADLDVRYTFFGSDRSRIYRYRYTECGFLTGLSVGFAHSGLSNAISSQFTNLDYLGNQVDYTTSGEARWTTSRLYAEVPVMFALRSSGFIFHIGPKVQVPLWQRTEQTVQDADIDAYYPAYDVHVCNELITGQLQNSDKQTSDKRDPQLSILLGAELGREWTLYNGGHLGLMFYVDYNLWNNRSQSGTSQASIAVAPITDPQNPVPTVSVRAGSPSVTHPLQLGISFYYAFGRRYGKYPINHKPSYWIRMN